jgi:hypothetical protein
MTYFAWRKFSGLTFEPQLAIRFPAWNEGLAFPAGKARDLKVQTGVTLK